MNLGYRDDAAFCFKIEAFSAKLGLYENLCHSRANQ
jgi:hypothetical protein